MNMDLKLRPKSECMYDELSLGEVMLRLDPGEGRIRTAREFRASEGGGEYNVARGLAKCFGLKTAVVTALAKNDVGYLVEELIDAGKVDSQFIVWKDFDGIGRSVRNGLNFTERGFGVRGALGVSDRANTAASQLKVGDVDWEYLFGTLGVRWLHTGGIFAALSETTAEVVIEALKVAKKYGTIVSYDLNYRPSLWSNIGGQAKAQEVNKEIAKYVDVMIGNEEDFTACLGFEIEGNDENLKELDIEGYKRMLDNVAKVYPNFKAIGNTLREVKSATVNDWAAMVWAGGEIYKSRDYKGLEIMDRVGGGDSFASGLIYGLMETQDPQKAVEYGAAHGALAMTTPGDTSMARKAEVEKLMGGGSARVQR
ncbi:sugar kinase [Proteiniclasticum sp. BAD-10]|uniref:Sugar kinase n=2 Tax=Proteiniclasticum sediminis TaxID=2804028 RepID=A0A941HPZ2_9CLOT|nr:sugar kinase [Proteiniclasticum sediminis]MBR0574903.1 sugar kinase [Proteiniclasticum sediminis]